MPTKPAWTADGRVDIRRDLCFQNFKMLKDERALAAKFGR